MNRRRDALPPELSDTAELLKSERASLDPAVDERLRARLDRAASRPFAQARRASVAITLCLALGALFSVGGTSLAVSGLGSPDVTAKSAQYPTATAPSTSTGNQEVLGEAGTEESSGDGVSADPPSDGNGGGDAGVAGESDSGTDPDQAGRQVAASEAEGLPFTGYAAVPLLLLGVALLTAGVVLRRRTI